MKKASKKSITLLAIVCGVVALLSLALYLYGILGVHEDQSMQEGNNQTADITPTDSSVAAWSGHIAELGPKIAEGFPEQSGLGQARVSRVADLTGDGVNEALISTGGGGAYMEDMALVILKNGKPELARFKTEQGEIGPLLFSEGASVRHAETIELDVAARSIYQQSIDVRADGSGLERCEVAAYQWSVELDLFVFNAAESDRAESTFCPLKEAEARSMSWQ